jgi:hypothetical protein
VGHHDHVLLPDEFVVRNADVPEVTDAGGEPVDRPAAGQHPIDDPARGGDPLPGIVGQLDRRAAGDAQQVRQRHGGHVQHDGVHAGPWLPGGSRRDTGSATERSDDAVATAEDGRFELPRGCPQPAFQASAIGH